MKWIVPFAVVFSFAQSGWSATANDAFRFLRTLVGSHKLSGSKGCEKIEIVAMKNGQRQLPSISFESDRYNSLLFSPSYEQEVWNHCTVTPNVMDCQMDISSQMNKTFVRYVLTKNGNKLTSARFSYVEEAADFPRNRQVIPMLKCGK